MKLIYTLLLLFSFTNFSFSQKEKIQELEAGLPAKSGVAFVTDAIALSELYYRENRFEMSGRRADEAYNVAKEENLGEMVATALNRRGMAIMEFAKGKRVYLNRAYKSFVESNSYTADNNLKLENLQNMKVLAAILGKEKDLPNINYNIGVLKGENPTPPPGDERTGFFNKRKRAIREYQIVQAEKQNLAEELSELTEEQDALRDQQEALVGLLVVKENAILNMSDEQMKRELLLSEQERLLDSLTFSSILDSLELSQSELLVEQQKSELREQEAEIDLQKSQRNLLLAMAGLFVLTAIGFFHRFHVIKRHNAVLAEKNNIIGEERKRSEELLLNILPKTVAEELKLNGQAEAQHYKNATVLFADFIGFSKISKLLTPQQLIADLDYAFKNFDAIIEKYSLEKIKTIGDAYMCAGGVPQEGGPHPLNVVKAAIEMQRFLVTWNQEKRQKKEPLFEARIGIHTGPLVAGVVGSKKFAYDIWGDTVNVASRMETSCEAGKVNISASTFSKIKNDFSCEYRGKVPAKNVGEVEMYYVESEN